MVVHVVYRRRENSWRGGDASVRFVGAAAMSSSPSSGKHQVCLASRAVGSSPLRTPASPSGCPGARIGGRVLCATLPPISIASTPSWGSRRLRGDGEEDWEEVIALGDEAVGTEDAAEEYGVVFEAPPTDEEVRAAVASIQQVFENPSGVDSDALELQALALPISGLPSSGMFVNYFSEDFHESETDLKGKETDAKESDLKLKGSSSAPPGMMKWVLENTHTKIK